MTVKTLLGAVSVEKITSVLIVTVVHLVTMTILAVFPVNVTLTELLVSSVRWGEGNVPANPITQGCSVNSVLLDSTTSLSVCHVTAIVKVQLTHIVTLVLTVSATANPTMVDVIVQNVARDTSTTHDARLVTVMLEEQQQRCVIHHMENVCVCLGSESLAVTGVHMDSTTTPTA